MKKYSVAEFASLVNMTPQAIYKRIKTGKLNDYIIRENNKTYIAAAAADRLNPVDKPGLKVDKPVYEPVDKPGLKVDEPTEEKAALIKQLEQKDRQIIFLQEQLEKLTEDSRKKDEYIIEQGLQLSRLLEQSNILNKNNQILMGLEKPAEDEPNTTQKQQSTVEQPSVKKLTTWFKNLFN